MPWSRNYPPRYCIRRVINFPCIRTRFILCLLFLFQELETIVLNQLKKAVEENTKVCELQRKCAVIDEITNQYKVRIESLTDQVSYFHS